MKMSYIWAILALIFGLCFGSTAFAATPSEQLACKDAALAAAPFEGTTAHREWQARHQADDTKVLINGTMTARAHGQTIWSLCAPPAFSEQLAAANARVASLAADNRRLTTENARLHTLAYHVVNGVRGAATSESWRSTATRSAVLLKRADASRTYGVALVLVCLIGMLFAGIFVIGLYLNNNKLQAEIRRLRNTIPETAAQRSEPEPWVHTTSAD